MNRRIIPRFRTFFISGIYVGALVVWGLLVFQTVQVAEQVVTLPARSTATALVAQTEAPAATAQAAAAIRPTPFQLPNTNPTAEPVAVQSAGFHPKTGRYIAVWMPPTFAGGARDSFEANKDVIDEVSPFWYGVRTDGQLYGTRNDELVRIAHENNILIIPTIHNVGDYNSVVHVLSNDALRARHIQFIVDEVMARNYDGIDIDYESLSPSLRAPYSAFIKDLAEALHSQGKMLTAAVHAKSSDYGGLGGFQDWVVMGQYVDRLRIMTYDYSWRGGGPGPVSPLYWVEEVANYARSVVDPGKVVIGVPFYGYNWPSNGGAATAMSWGSIEELIEKSDLTVNLRQRDTRGRVDESYFTYSAGQGQRTVWFSTQNSLDSKLALIQEMDLAGIAIWQLGYEDPKNWDVIRRRLVEDPFVLQRAINPLLPEH